MCSNIEANPEKASLIGHIVDNLCKQHIQKP